MNLQTAEISSLQSRYRESQTAASDFQFQLLPVQFELTKISREKDLLAAAVISLQDIDSKRSQESIQERRDHANKVFELESKMLTAARELEDCRARLVQSQVTVVSID